MTQDVFSAEQCTDGALPQAYSYRLMTVQWSGWNDDRQYNNNGVCGRESESREGKQWRQVERV